MSSPAPVPIGVIAHYNLLERLEPAGPGELFRARDTRHGRTVTIRLLPADFYTSPGTILDRVRSVMSLSHPNVLTLFDAGQHEGRVYLVFEFVRGQSLRAEMAGRQVNVRRAVEYAVQIADAVAGAHALGFVHGGLSPESVIVTAKGHAKIPGFELATRGGFEADGRDVKLHDYDAPEEARGGAPDDRSDIYSVGAILYEMLTTRRPHHGGASAPSASNPHVPGELDAVALKAVAPNPDLRYQSMATFAAELRGVNALLDARGLGDDEDEPRAPATSLGRVLLTSAVILIVVAAIAWWAMRP